VWRREGMRDPMTLIIAESREIGQRHDHDAPASDMTGRHSMPGGGGLNGANARYVGRLKGIGKKRERVMFFEVAPSASLLRTPGGPPVPGS